MAIHTTGNSVSLTAQEHRNQTAALLPPFKSSLGVRGGTHSGFALAKTSGMGFSLTAGRVVVEPSAPSAGPYVVTSDATATMAFDPGDASRDRIDVIAVKVNEAAGVENAGSIVILKGAYPASGEPVRPAIPNAHEELYAVEISAGTSSGNGGWSTSKRVDLRRNLVAIGTPIPVNSVSERNGLAVYEGMQVMRLDLNGTIDRYIDGTWKGNTSWINCTYSDGWSGVSGGTPLRVKLTADGLIGMLGGEVKWGGINAAWEGMIVGTIPASAMAAGIIPENNSWVIGTDDTYRQTMVIQITAAGQIRLGPSPTGRVFMFQGTFPIQAN